MMKLMTNWFFLVIFIMSYPILNAQSKKILWATGGGGSGYDRGHAIAVDRSDNILITGFFDDVATFGKVELTTAGNNDVIIAKYDKKGNTLWATQAGGKHGDSGTSITVDDSNNVIVTGSFGDIAKFGDTEMESRGDRDIFISKYDADGNLLWVKQAGGSGEDVGNSIETDSEGNILLTGYFWGFGQFEDTVLVSKDRNSEIFLAKYDLDGNLVWAEQAGGLSRCIGSAITVDNSNNIIITGNFVGEARFGDTTLTATGRTDAFIAKYKSNGTFLWAVQGSGTGSKEGHSVACDESRNIVVTGFFKDVVMFGDSKLHFTGGLDAFIAKYNEDGKFLWATQAGGLRRDSGEGVVVDKSGNISVVGYLDGEGKFGNKKFRTEGSFDAFVSTYNSEGKFLELTLVGGSSFDEGHSIALDHSGNKLITGAFNERARFGKIKLKSAGGGGDVFIAKLR